LGELNATTFFPSAMTDLGVKIVYLSYHHVLARLLSASPPFETYGDTYPAGIAVGTHSSMRSSTVSIEMRFVLDSLWINSNLEHIVFFDSSV
jgi:hypothetical protein